jgi:hypothetical protein
MSADDCPDYPTIKTMALALGRPAHSLYVLSSGRDPFFIQPARQARAKWFVDVWKAVDPPRGVHLRRLHYLLVSLPEDRRPRKLDGALYENTEHDWDLLNAASVDARALQLVDAPRFTDRRAGEPIYVADDSGEDEEASVAVRGADVDQPEAESAFSLTTTHRTTISLIRLRST